MKISGARLLPLLAVALALLLVAAVAYGLTHRSASVGGTSGGGADLLSGSQSAPEFAGISDWENTTPLTMSGLRGKVVLIDFWTYSCINCQRTFPFLRAWWQKYRGSGLVIVGVHSPEFDFEKSVPNIRAAIAHYGVDWPVAVDSRMDTWNAWSNQYWPAEYLVDKDGRVRHVHFGEGEYDQTESAIRTLLVDAGARLPPVGGASIDPGISRDANQQTPELYAARSEYRYDPDGFQPNQPFLFKDPGGHRPNILYFAGLWTIHDESSGEFAEHARDAPAGDDYVEVSYQARRVFMVAAASAGTVRALVTLDGHDLAPADAGADVTFAGGHAYLEVSRSDLYAVVNRADFAGHVLRISPQGKGFQLFTFTFGS